MPRIPALAGVALVLGACTPGHAGPDADDVEVARLEPAAVDPPLEGTTVGCTPRFSADPHVPPATTVPATVLHEAAAWSTRVDVRGGYAHQVDFDGEGNVAWAHDAGSMRFELARLRPDGERTWTHRLDPAEHEPQTLTSTPSGATLIAGAAFAEPFGHPVVAIGPDGAELWRQDTPRLSVDHLAPAPGGRTVAFGHSGREEVTLGEHTMANEWPGVQGMDVLAVLNRDGEYAWSRHYLPGVLDVAVDADAIYLAGNYGDFEVDFGTGPVRGPGVLTRVDAASGEPRWSRRFETGLKAIVPQGDDLLVIGFPGLTSSTSMGGPQLTGTPAAWLDARGCYRGSVSLGTHIGRVDAGDDGSLVVWGLATTPVQLGSQTFEVPPGHWFVARFDAQLKLTAFHTTSCDAVDAAAGPSGRTAVSCYRDVSTPTELVRRYELFVLD